MNQNDAGFTDRQLSAQDHQDRNDASAPPGHRGAGLRLVDWLNGHLMSTFGPPPIGPYGDVTAQVAGVCPVCTHPMGEHIIDRSATNAVLICPVTYEGQFEHVDDAPLNEVGMPRHQE